jgi:uncharacterized protein DUF6491
MRSVPVTVVACAAVVLVGEAGAKPRSPDGKVCFARREINAVSALDERHALARLSAGRLYLLTLDKTCTGLKWARKIVLERTASRVCGDGASLLSFEEPGAGPTRCRIEKIDGVENKAEALELIDSRAGPR